MYIALGWYTRLSRHTGSTDFSTSMSSDMICLSALLLCTDSIFSTNHCRGQIGERPSRFPHSGNCEWQKSRRWAGGEKLIYGLSTSLKQALFLSSSCFEVSRPADANSNCHARLECAAPPRRTRRSTLESKGEDHRGVDSRLRL